MSGMSKTDIHALRFLLIHGDPGGADRLASLLAAAHHVVVATPNLAEATEALCIERFDAIVLDAAALPLAEVAEFAAGLRRIEERQGLARIPMISISSETAVNSSVEPDHAAWDAWLQEPLDPAALTEAVTRLAQAVGHPAAQPAAAASESSVLEPEEFEEQMGGDRELMVEIIDLFFEERQRQVTEMRHALASGNFTQLSRLAHTIKGSLGSLRATRARWGAHELESAASGGDANRCRESFSSFEQDLTELEPELRLLRERVAGQLPTL